MNQDVSEIPVISGEAVLASIDPATAVDRTRHAFEQYARGEWVMPPKVYLDSPPFGDFRAMPARGDGLALLKWVTSFPGNSDRGLPVVRGVDRALRRADGRGAGGDRVRLGDLAADRRGGGGLGPGAGA